MNSHPVILTCIHNDLCGFDALRPHRLANLASGLSQTGEIECPVHGWRFNLRTGKSIYSEDDGANSSDTACEKSMEKSR